MLSVPIEAEIEQEQKIFKGITMKQMVCVVAAAAIGLVSYRLTGNFNDTLIYGGVFMAIPILIGFFEMNGLRVNELFRIILQRIVYRNTARKYKTKNAYYALLNGQYQAMRTEDYKDKAVIRANKAEAKRVKKAMKRSKYKPLP